MKRTLKPSPMVKNHIEATLRRINAGYVFGTLAWIKKRRLSAWRSLKQMELAINVQALKGDEAGLVQALADYEALIGQMGKRERELEDVPGIRWKLSLISK